MTLAERRLLERVDSRAAATSWAFGSGLLLLAWVLAMVGAVG